MDAQAFWDVIGRYNQTTWPIQIGLLLFIAISLTEAFLHKAVWLPKIAFGVTNLFIAVVFFLIYGTEPIQTYFAFPLYIGVGTLFLWEGIKHRGSKFTPFNKLQWVLLGLVAVYPVVSLCLGHSFPQMVVYIMPCPIVSLSIVVYAAYEHRNKLLLALLTIWGLTGVKSFFFNAIEDVILLICGIYCLCLLVSEFKRTRKV